MGLRFYAVIILLLSVSGSLASSGSTESNQHKDDDSYMATILGGSTETPTEFKEIYELLDKKKLTKAQEKVTELIERSSNLFKSAKQEKFFKGNAYYLRSEIAGERGNFEARLDDMKRAANFGHPYAPYNVAALLTIKCLSIKGLDKRRAYLEEAYAYQLMGAELGDPLCIDQIQSALRAKRQLEDEHYWFLLERMSEGSEKVSQFRTIYFRDYTSDDRLLFDRVMGQLSLSKGQYESTIPGLPGRSTLTAAFIDLNMRKQLGFIWSVFFRKSGKYQMHEVYQEFRKIVQRNPLVDLWLLVNRRYRADAGAFALDINHLIENMLPGDEIVVRCGRLSHYSIIWDVDKAKNEVLLLDPFYEFWQPSHNRCVTVFERYTYKYGRHLVRVSLSELKRMLVAVFSIRDRLL